MLVYVIIQVLTVSILSHMCYLFLRKNRQFLKQRRHNSDSYVNINKNNKKFFININDDDVFPHVFK